MNSNFDLVEQRYQTKIYLNDRPYKVLDMGEGECSITIVCDIEEYLTKATRFSTNHRSIIVDISEVLSDEQQDDGRVETTLASDLHLLFDVFWLDEVTIHSEVSNLNMSAIYDVVRIRNYSRALLK